jgi:(2R)-sulfolactate sulfo-lyase subunit beta
MQTKFWGYRRKNGRVGVRNHVIILPVDDLSNAASEAVANNIKGTLAIPHPYGRLQFGADLDLHFRTLIGAGSNPNVAAVVVIGIEDGWTKKVVDGIAATGSRCRLQHRIAWRSRHDHVHRRARGFCRTSELHRVECDLKDLWVSTKCGESDTTSGTAPVLRSAMHSTSSMPPGTLVFGETTELTGGEKYRGALPRRQGGRNHARVRPLPE